MKIQTLIAAASVAAMSFATGEAAYAQAAAAPAAPAITHGPALPGVCVLSVDGVIANSTVGKYVQTRLNQIGTQAQSELSAEQTAITNDAKALDAKKATLDQGAFDQQNAALQVRANAWNRKAQQRERELQATQQKAIGRIGQEMNPVVGAAYQQAKCSILIQRDAVMVVNPAMDITQQVITGLNAKITQFTFDRERLDQAATPPQTSK